ncbi:hypothetical protein [Lacihabitans soyangensis]|uniref:Uncharacterized protein n=1 Tax=Lacihabitans soyangensis TaxID=869394 RepID=A0AAE3KVE2_9BACT|nr:hypothetical protein [Lacihabitans soyangensis]MCP9766058.1 hypothetical protein [Lacihabitans soyangensis]
MPTKKALRNLKALWSQRESNRAGVPAGCRTIGSIVFEYKLHKKSPQKSEGFVVPKGIESGCRTTISNV